MSKKNLTKLALMGLLVASTEATVNATESTNSGFQSGTLLAGGCKAGGCKAIAWQQAPAYPTSNGCHAYQNQGTQDQGGYYYQETQPAGCKTMNNAPSQQGYYPSQGMQHSCGKGSCGPKPYPNNQQMQQSNVNKQPQNFTSYNTTSTRFPATAPNYTSYNTGDGTGRNAKPYEIADMGTDSMMSNSNKSMTESELLNKLNNEDKQAYWNLNPQGRSKAVDLANQGKDVHTAVKEAAAQSSSNR